MLCYHTHCHSDAIILPGLPQCRNAASLFLSLTLAETVSVMPFLFWCSIFLSFLLPVPKSFYIDVVQRESFCSMRNLPTEVAVRCHPRRRLDHQRKERKSQGANKQPTTMLLLKMQMQSQLLAGVRCLHHAGQQWSVISTGCSLSRTRKCSETW